MLSDTTIREFLQDDYARIVNAVALVIGDLGDATGLVQEALVLAWTRSERGEPIEALASWVTGAALRRSRRRLHRTSPAATADATDVRRALALLPRRTREVAVLRHFLRMDTGEASEVLGMRAAAVERRLEEARAALTAGLLDDAEGDVSPDEVLTDLIGQTERRVEVDTRLFERLVARMTRRERTRRVATVGFVAAAIAVGAGVYAMTGRSTTASSPTPTGSGDLVQDGPVDAATLPGVPFPACHVSTTHSFSDRWFGTVYLFGKGSPTESCFELGSSPTYIALDRGGLGRPKDTVVFGPIDCAVGCRAFATGDVDGDGSPELAVVLLSTSGADRIELYRVHPDAPKPFWQITTSFAGQRTPFSFEWGGERTFRSGAKCTSRAGMPTSHFDVWTATRRFGVWHLEERFYTFQGVTATKVGVRTSTTADENRLPGTLDFCGMPVGL